MDLDEQLELAHLLLQERKCRVCGQEKNLIDKIIPRKFFRGKCKLKVIFRVRYLLVIPLLGTRSSRVVDPQMTSMLSYLH